MNTPNIILSQEDYEKISQLIYQNDSDIAALLEEELSRADLVPQTELPANVVAMRSQVTYKDSVTGQESTITLVYPHEANLAENRISILASVGAALIGLKEGAAIQWPLPNGTKKEFKVVKVSQETLLV
jgi:regulator of nucleoside diphosphate kinase